MLIDLREYIGDLQTVKSFPLFFKRYEIENHEGKKYLVGYDFVKRSVPAAYNSPAVLFGFVNLVQPPLPHSFLSDDETPMRQAIPDKRIKRFCKKFGMPYLEGRGNLHPAMENMVWDYINLPVGVIELDTFRWRVAWLYTHFQVWYALYSGKNKTKILSDFIAGQEQTGKQIEEIAKDQLAHEITLQLEQLPITIEYAHGKYVLGFRARYLFDIAYFHLANLLTMGKPCIKRHLKVCNNPRCRQLFWAQHGRQKYCDFCDRRVVFAQQKKGVRTNGRVVGKARQG
ncbi:MAG: hypothetical protein H5U02_10095 [Clostridia bacterium]|nr:hypothetical protein [Clostridia bacterium]